MVLKKKVCTIFNESFWVGCSTTNIHVIAGFIIQLMGHHSKETITLHHQHLIFSSHVVLIKIVTIQYD